MDYIVFLDCRCILVDKCKLVHDLLDYNKLLFRKHLYKGLRNAGWYIFYQTDNRHYCNIQRDQVDVESLELWKFKEIIKLLS